MNKQSGFNKMLTIIAAVVLVGVLGLIGWHTYNHPSKQLGTTTNNIGQPIKAIETAATVTPQGTYLDFTEIGVKVSLNSSINDAVYAPFDIPSTDGSKAYGISAQSLINNETKDYCNADHGPIGIVIASATAPTSLAGPVPVDNKTVFKYGSTYYRYVPPQNLGCAIGQVTTDAARSKINAFTQAFTTLQTDN